MTTQEMWSLGLSLHVHYRLSGYVILGREGVFYFTFDVFLFMGSILGSLVYSENLLLDSSVRGAR